MPIIKGKLGKQLNALEYVDGTSALSVKRNLGYEVMDDVTEDDYHLLELIFLDRNLFMIVL